MKTENLQVKFILLALSLCLSIANAQQAIPASGGEAESSGGSISYSIGQLFWHTHEANNGSVAEGVQQPFEISVVTAVDETEGIQLKTMAYPNPAADFLTLEVKTLDTACFQYQLFDINGKLLRNEKIKGYYTKIDMSSLMSGIYFLKVIQGNQSFKTFKIIKK